MILTEQNGSEMKIIGVVREKINFPSRPTPLRMQRTIVAGNVGGVKRGLF